MSIDKVRIEAFDAFFAEHSKLFDDSNRCILNDTGYQNALYAAFLAGEKLGIQRRWEPVVVTPPVIVVPIPQPVTGPAFAPVPRPNTTTPAPVKVTEVAKALPCPVTKATPVSQPVKVTPVTKAVPVSQPMPVPHPAKGVAVGFISLQGHPKEVYEYVGVQSVPFGGGEAVEVIQHHKLATAAVFARFVERQKQRSNLRWRLAKPHERSFTEEERLSLQEKLNSGEFVETEFNLKSMKDQSILDAVDKIQKSITVNQPLLDALDEINGKNKK